MINRIKSRQAEQNLPTRKKEDPNAGSVRDGEALTV